jgi:hypothetical protein
MTPSALDTDQAARKRQAIGLSPRRETAGDQVLRPPPTRYKSRTLEWLLVLFTAMFAVVTAMLVTAKLIGAPTDWQSVRAAVASLWATPARGAVTVVPLEDNFSSEQSVLVRDFEFGRWSMGVEPAGGVYHFRLQPGTVAWSTLGRDALASFWLATSVRVAPDTPQGYGGILARYSDDQNLYMVQVDGLQRFRVQAQQQGRWATLKDWTEHQALLPAGQFNELLLEDEGSAVRVYANDSLLFQTDAPGLPPGDAGVMAGSAESLITEVDFDWLEVGPLGQ